MTTLLVPGVYEETVDIGPYLALSDSSLLAETELEPSDSTIGSTMTLLEHTMLAMYASDVCDVETCRRSILVQVAEGSLRIVATTPTPDAFASFRPDGDDWHAFFEQCRIAYRHGRQTLYLGDCLTWLRSLDRTSIAGVITDPPYGIGEYEPPQIKKLRAGHGGIWRNPPSFDGATRRALPRFTVLSDEDRRALIAYFTQWGKALFPVLMPGAHVLIAGTPLLSPLVAMAMMDAGFERRGEVVRLLRTLRGGDRPKGHEDAFPMVSTMPRACWEPWGLYRRPLSEQTVARNLQRWGVGGLRRRSEETPFLDVVESETTPQAERALGLDHPSIKPQRLLRGFVDALRPLGEGTLLDTFAGSGSTLAACEALGAPGIGIERDLPFFENAAKSIPHLAHIAVHEGKSAAPLQQIGLFSSLGVHTDAGDKQP